MQSIPVGLMNSFVNSPVAYNREIFLFKINMKKNRIEFCGFIHAKFFENIVSSVSIFVFSIGVDVHPDLAGRMIFRRLYRIYKQCDLLICKEIAHVCFNYSENTSGAFSAPAAALKDGFSLKLVKFAMMLEGNCLIEVL